MRILIWHVHGGWTDAFVRGNHEYLLPTTPARDAWGLGRGGRAWPDTAIEVAPESLRTADIDVVILQRPQEIAETEQLLGRRPGRDLPAIYVEHNTPRENVPDSRHPLADRSDILLVHVTHFNRLLWDSGRAPTVVIEHGIPDPGARYAGDLDRFGVVVNEPLRRWRVVGTDLLPAFAAIAPVDAFGMGADGLRGAFGGTASVTALGDQPTAVLHQQLAKRRVYLHLTRWTSLGLSLLEAMHLGMPVVALATTEATRAVPPEAGAISNDIDELLAAGRRLIEDPEEARRRGRVARTFALEHFGLKKFLDSWDTVLANQAPSAQTPQLLSTHAAQ